MSNKISRSEEVLKRLEKFTKYVKPKKWPKKKYHSTLRVEKKKKRKRRFKTAA